MAAGKIYTSVILETTWVSHIRKSHDNWTKTGTRSFFFFLFLLALDGWWWRWEPWRCWFQALHGLHPQESRLLVKESDELLVQVSRFPAGIKSIPAAKADQLTQPTRRVLALTLWVSHRASMHESSGNKPPCIPFDAGEISQGLGTAQWGIDSYLAFVTVNENRMQARIQQNLENLCASLPRNDHRCILVWRNRQLEMSDPILPHEVDIFQRIFRGNEGPKAPSTRALYRYAEHKTYRILFSPKDWRCSKLLAAGKPLRYIPGMTSAKLLGGPATGEGGPLSSTLAIALTAGERGDWRHDMRWPWPSTISCCSIGFILLSRCRKDEKVVQKHRKEKGGAWLFRSLLTAFSCRGFWVGCFGLCVHVAIGGTGLYVRSTRSRNSIRSWRLHTNVTQNWKGVPWRKSMMRRVRATFPIHGWWSCKPPT